MNKILMAGLLILSSIEAHANVSIKYDLQSTAVMSWERHTSYERGRCYTFGKGDDTDILGNETATGAMSGESGPGVESMNTTASKFLPAVVRTTSVSLSDQQSGDSETVDLSMPDTINRAPNIEYGDGDCDHRHYIGSFVNSSLSGEMALRYQMPAHTWLIALTPKELTGFLTTSLQTKIGGSIEGDNILVGKKIYVWAEPGSFLEIHFAMRGATEAQSLGHVNFLFEPVGSVYTLQDEGIKAFKSFIPMNHGGAKDIFHSGPKVREEFINTAASLLRSKDVLESTLQATGTDAFARYADFILEVANAEITDDLSVDSEAEKGIMVKSVAAVLAYQISVQMLTDLQTFCKDITIDLPFQKDNVKVMGFMASYYWLHRSEQRLKAYDYAVVNEVLDQLVRYENEKLTYAAVANDKVAFGYLTLAYNKLMNHGDIGADPYADFSGDINRSIQIFGSIGTAEKTTQGIVDDLKAMSQKHMALMSQLVKQLRSYKVDNTSPVLSTPMVAQLNEIQRERKSVVDSVESQVKFLSVGNGDASGEDFVAFITKLLTQEMGIFSEKLDKPYIENIRSEYIKFNNIDSLKSSYNKCIKGDS